MTQAQLSVAVGHEYYTSISAVETGRNTPPPERLLDYAEALGVTPTEFGKRVLELTNPWLYAMLFSKTPRETFATLNGDIETRAGRNPSKRRPPTRTTKA